MIGRIVLCTDQESREHPEVLGLADVSLDALSWLSICTSGGEVRRAVQQEPKADEVWIASSPDISAINLTAALRKDGYQGTVCMVTDEASGSALSRATAAGVNEVYALDRFVQRFSVEANRRKRMEEVRETLVMPQRPSAQATASPVRQAKVAGNPRKTAGREVRAPQVSKQLYGSGRLIVVMGASGGVGKSTVAACLGAVTAAQGKRVLLMDGDLQFGCLHRMFGEAPSVAFGEVAEDTSSLDELATKAKAGMPAVLAAPERLEHSESLAGSVAALAAAATERFDAVIVDTSASWSEAHAQFIEMATGVMFLIDQRMESIRACQHALELCKRMGLATSSFIFALNRCSKEAVLVPADVSYALNGTHIHEIKDGGPDVEELCGGGLAATLPVSGNPFVTSIEAMGAQVMPELFERDALAARERGGAAFFRVFGQGRQRQRRRQRKDHEIIVQAGPPHPRFANAQQAWESL